MAAGRNQIPALLLGLISSLLTCLQINVAMINHHLNYVGDRLSISRLLFASSDQCVRLKRLKRLRKQPRPRRFWIRPGRTSAWWDNFVSQKHEILNHPIITGFKHNHPRNPVLIFPLTLEFNFPIREYKFFRNTNPGI